MVKSESAAYMKNSLPMQKVSANTLQTLALPYSKVGCSEHLIPVDLPDLRKQARTEG